MLLYNFQCCNQKVTILSNAIILRQKAEKLRMSLNQNVSHGFDALIPFISSVFCYVSTRVGVIRISSCTKPDSGITRIAFVFVVTKDTDPYPGV